MFDEPHCDAQPAAGAPDATLDQVADSELEQPTLRIGIFPDRKGRLPCQNGEPTETRQICDDVLCERSGKVGQRAIFGKVLEGKDDDERLACGGSVPPAENPGSVEGLQERFAARLTRGPGELLKVCPWPDLMILCKTNPKLIVPPQGERALA
jgi:hypothetical protein